MFNEIAVVAVTPFSGTSTPDKNSKQAVMLQCIAGKIPNRNVLSGTVAERAGLEVGRTYMVQVRETGEDMDFGFQFNWVKIKELETGKDIVNTIQELGAPEIIIIPQPKGYKEWYERKGNAIESSITQRIKEGKFKPSIPRSLDHRDAEVIPGSSQQILNKIDDDKANNKRS